MGGTSPGLGRTGETRLDLAVLRLLLIGGGGHQREVRGQEWRPRVQTVAAQPVKGGRQPAGEGGAKEVVASTASASTSAVLAAAATPQEHGGCGGHGRGRSICFVVSGVERWRSCMAFGRAAGGVG